MRMAAAQEVCRGEARSVPVPFGDDADLPATWVVDARRKPSTPVVRQDATGSDARVE